MVRLTLLIATVTALTAHAQSWVAHDPLDTAKIVQALAYAPDGATLAVAGEGGEIALWNVADRKVTARLTGHTETVYDLAWSKDGGRLASAGGDKTAVVWDVAARKARHTLKHPGGVYAVAVSADGKTVATGGFDKVVRLWDADTGAEKAKRVGHTASVRCLAFNPDGEELASGGADYTIRRWDLTGDRVRELRGHTRAVRSIAYLAPGLLASGGDDGQLLVWNLAEGEPLHTFGPFPDGVPAVAASQKGGFLVAGLATGKVHVIDPFEEQTRAVLSGGTDAVAAVAVSPDGRQVAAGGFDRTVRVWSSGAKTATPTVTYSHPGPVRTTAISPDRLTVATGAADGTIRLFDAAAGREKAEWAGHDGAVEDLAFSADGTALASGGADRAAKLWKLADRTLVKAFPDHPGPVRRVAVSAKATLLATATIDREVRVHDVAGGTIKKLNAEAPPTALQFLADDSLLTGGGPRAYVWDVREGRVLDTLDGGQFARVTGLAGTADGKLFVVAGEPTAGSQLAKDVGFSRVLAVSRHHPTNVSQRLDDTGVGVSRAAVSPDGRVIAVVGGDGLVRAWEWPAPTTIRKFPAHGAAVLGLALSTHGEFLVTASADGTARRWNASRGEPLVYAAKLLDESKQARFARVSPDGKMLISGGDDKVLRVRDAVPGGFTALAGDYECAFSVAVSPDGATLATGHFNGHVYLWDLKTGKQTKALSEARNRVWSLAFSPDGTRLVAGGGNWDQTEAGELHVWDTATWKPVHQLAAHEDLVFQVAVSPDGKRVATCSRDQSVRVWDLTTGKVEHTLRIHAGAVRTVAFTRDGKRLYSGGFDGRLQWWDPVAGKAIDGKALGVSAVQRMRLSPDGKTLALALGTVATTGHAALWDVEKDELVRTFGAHDGQVNDVAFSPDGLTLVSVGGRYAAAPTYEPGPVGPWTVPVTVTRDGKTTSRQAPASEVRCWDVATGSPLAALAGPKHWVESAQFTPDGTRLITVGGVAGHPGEVRLFDFAGIRPKAVLPLNGAQTCGQFNPDGSLFATGGADGTIVVWTLAKALDTSTKKVIPAHKGAVRTVAWSADGSRLISTGEDGGRTWDAKSGEPAPSTAAAEPRGRFRVGSPTAGLVKVWETATGREVFEVVGHPGKEVFAIELAPDGQTILSAGGDGAVGVWKVPGGVWKVPAYVPPAPRPVPLPRTPIIER